MLLSYVIWFVTVLWIVFWVECSSTAASLCRALLKDVGRRVVHEHFHGRAGLSRSQLGLHLQPCSGSSSWVEHHCTEDSVSCYFLFLLRGNFNVSLRNYSEHWVTRIGDRAELQDKLLLTKTTTKRPHCYRLFPGIIWAWAIWVSRRQKHTIHIMVCFGASDSALMLTLCALQMLVLLLLLLLL